MSVVGAVSSVFGGLRFIWSAAMDKYKSYKLIYAILIVLAAFLAFTLELVRGNKTLYMIWICLTIFCEGGHFSLIPTVVPKLFGAQAPRIYGFLLVFNGFVALIQAVVVQ